MSEIEAPLLYVSSTGLEIMKANAVTHMCTDIVLLPQLMAAAMNLETSALFKTRHAGMVFTLARSCEGVHAPTSTAPSLRCV
jgi:hypothetical protein